jgi:O-antigen/teichoic acid export membrane protein
MEEDLHSKGPRRLVTGGAWFLGLMILSGVFWLVLGIQITRTYGLAGFGVFNTASSVFDFMWALIFGGLFEGLIHFGASYLTKKDANLAHYFSKYVRCLTAMSLILFGVLVFLSFQTSDVMSRVLLLSLAVAFLVSGTKDSLASILGSLHKSKQLSIIQSSGFYAVSLIGMVLAELSMPSDLLPVLIVIAPICQLIMCMYFLRHYLKDLVSYNIDFFTHRDKEQSLLDDIKQFRHILVFGFSISVGKISFMVMKNLDIPILTLFFDYTNVGVYSVADTVSSVMFSMTAFAIPVLSSMSEAWTKQDHVLMKKYVKISVKYPLLIGLPLMIIIFALAEPIVVGIYGAAAQEAVMPLQILIIGTFLLMFGRNLSSILIGIGKAKLSGTLMAIAAIQYLISLFILVPIFGLIGGAISLTLTGITSLVLIPFFIKHHLNVDAFSGVHKMLFSSAVLATILLLVPKTNILFIIAGLAAGLAAFILILYYTGYINQEDIKILKSSREQP